MGHHDLFFSWWDLHSSVRSLPGAVRQGEKERFETYIDDDPGGSTFTLLYVVKARQEAQSPLGPMMSKSVDVITIIIIIISVIRIVYMLRIWLALLWDLNIEIEEEVAVLWARRFGDDDDDAYHLSYTITFAADHRFVHSQRFLFVIE